MYVICIWYADACGEGLRKSFERKVGDTKTFGGAENFSKSRGTSEIFKSEYPVDSRGFDLSWKPRPERFLYHKLNLTPRRSLTIYMAADNEIYCWTKVENFSRVSTTFCRRIGRDSPAKRLLLLGRILVRTEVALASVRGHEREKCLVRSTV